VKLARVAFLKFEGKMGEIPIYLGDKAQAI